MLPIPATEDKMQFFIVVLHKLLIVCVWQAVKMMWDGEEIYIFMMLLVNNWLRPISIFKSIPTEDF